MNLASFLLCLVFAAIGYVVHPMLLSKLVDSKLVAESSLSDSYREEQAKKADKDLPKSGDDETKGTVSEPAKPEVVVIPTPAVPVPVIPTPELVPDPAPVEPEVETGVKLGEKEFIDALKASVKARDVNEFDFDQVLSWKRAGEEELDGGTYEVGMVTYKADTIFDEQQLEAKALIKDGKVVKWLWPTTNTKMR